VRACAEGVRRPVTNAATAPRFGRRERIFMGEDPFRKVIAGTFENVTTIFREFSKISPL
jgi:hypothetical protein